MTPLYISLIALAISLHTLVYILYTDLKMTKYHRIADILLYYSAIMYFVVAPGIVIYFKLRT